MSTRVSALVARALSRSFDTKMSTGISDFATAVIVVAGSLCCLPNVLRRRRAGEGAGAVRARRVADAGTARRAFRRAFFLISADDSGTALEGTIILRRCSSKKQIPGSKPQANIKKQNSKWGLELGIWSLLERARGCGLGTWDLKFVWDLELGISVLLAHEPAWDLGFRAPIV